MSGEPRLVRVPVSVEMIATMMVAGARVRPARCVKGLPKGAVYCRCFDGQDNTAWLVFSHPSFAALAHGDPIPQLDVMFMNEEA